MEKYLDRNSVLRLLQGIKTQIDKSKTSVLDTKGAENGIASLDENGNVPLSQLGNVDTDIHEIALELPTQLTEKQSKHIFLVPRGVDEKTNKNIYKEYIFTGSDITNVKDTDWEQLGEFTTSVDLKDYSKKSDTISDISFTDMGVDGSFNPNVKLNNLLCEFADGKRKLIVIPLASGPLDGDAHKLPGCPGFMSGEDKGKLDNIDLNALTASINAANTAANNTNTAIKAAETATLGAEKVDATLTEGNVFEVTDRTGAKKILDLNVTGSIGDVTKLKTNNKIIVNAINELSQKGGISAVAIELLGSILEKAVFVDDEKDNIAALVEELAKGGGGGAVVKKPTITQNASTYMVVMVSEGNSIYYTTNGDAPTKTSTLYTEPFVPDEDCTIKAVAIDADDNMSVVVSLAVKASDIITFADENLAKVAIAKTTEDVEVTLPDGTTTTVKGFGWDTDGSGFVQKSEAAQKTNFAFNSNNWITSFNEAKYFTNWKIEKYTLYGVTNLESINLPPVKNIGANNASFSSCGKLKKIIVNEGTERLELITGCDAITELSLPSTLTYFGGIVNSNGALKDTTLIVPENVTNFPSVYNTTSISRIKHLNPNLNTIDMTSFSFAGLSRHVWLAATTPPTLTGTAQGGGIGTVYVPDALVDTYKAAEGWSTITVKGHSEWID